MLPTLGGEQGADHPRGHHRAGPGESWKQLRFVSRALAAPAVVRAEASEVPLMTLSCWTWLVVACCLHSLSNLQLRPGDYGSAKSEEI